MNGGFADVLQKVLFHFLVEKLTKFQNVLCRRILFDSVYEEPEVMASAMQANMTFFCHDSFFSSFFSRVMCKKKSDIFRYYFSLQLKE